jgi:undecaprenyl-diphosphatase
MNWFDALILGIIQGLTEFLPVSSDGHLELGNAILHTSLTENLSFTVLLHGATVLSIIIVFYRELWTLMKDFFRFHWNESTQYIAKIVVSMIPVAIVGLFFMKQVEKLFISDVGFVGLMLVINGAILGISHFAKNKEKDISYFHAFLLGIAQAIAVLPGISRSGMTISSGLMLGNKRAELAKFSFLMVIVPIIGVNLKDMFFSGEIQPDFPPVGIMLIGFITAFVFGLLACKAMIKLVSKGKLGWFAIYCMVVGTIAIIVHYI